MTADVTSVDAAGDDAPARPFLSVVSGHPTDEELAALVGVFAAASTRSGDTDPGTRNEWGRPVDLFRQTWGQPGSFTNRGGW